MLSISSNRTVRTFLELLLLALLTFVIVAALASWAQGRAAVRAQATTVEDSTPTPPTRNYRGVQIGMTQEAARAKLGTAADKSDAQDYYTFSEQEVAQVFYDANRLVKAISITYTGTSAPTAQAVLGRPAAPEADGTSYLLVRYTKANYWVSYCRTAGDAPVVTVVIQRF